MCDSVVEYLPKKLEALSSNSSTAPPPRKRLMYNAYFGKRRKTNIYAGSVAQAVECLPCKCKAQNSNPSTHKKKGMVRGNKSPWTSLGWPEVALVAGTPVALKIPCSPGHGIFCL
jgi:hypothetical protein